MVEHHRPTYLKVPVCLYGGPGWWSTIQTEQKFLDGSSMLYTLVGLYFVIKWLLESGVIFTAKTSLDVYSLSREQIWTFSVFGWSNLWDEVPMVAVGLNALFIVLPHWNNMSYAHMLTHPVTLYWHRATSYVLWSLLHPEYHASKDHSPILSLWYDWTQHQPGIEPTKPLGQCYCGPPYRRLLWSAGATEDLYFTRSPHRGSPWSGLYFVVSRQLYIC